MMDVGSLALALEGAEVLPFHELGRYVPEPQESHHLFGAAFLLVGGLLAAESLAGRVWHRNRIRTLIWPATIMFLGVGMLIVTALEPNDRVIHFTIGLIMIAAGYYEARYRLKEIPRRSADWLVLPALIAGSLEIGVFHFHGSLNNSGLIHILMGITVAGMAFVRFYQGREPSSMPRHALMSVVVVVLALELLALNH